MESCKWGTKTGALGGLCSSSGWRCDGVDGKIDFEVDDPAFFEFLVRLIQRKQGLPSAQFLVNINTRFNFRGGARRICVVPQVSFGDVPLEVPERKQKVKGSLSFMAQGARFPRGV
jgi:hypothetical protein